MIVAGMPLNMMPTSTVETSTTGSEPVRIPIEATAHETNAIVIVRRRPIRSEIEPTMRPPAITAKPIVVKASAARPEFHPASSSSRATVKLMTRM